MLRRANAPHPLAFRAGELFGIEVHEIRFTERLTRNDLMLSLENLRARLSRGTTKARALQLYLRSLQGSAWRVPREHGLFAEDLEFLRRAFDRPFTAPADWIAPEDAETLTCIAAFDLEALGDLEEASRTLESLLRRQIYSASPRVLAQYIRLLTAMARFDEAQTYVDYCAAQGIQSFELAAAADRLLPASDDRYEWFFRTTGVTPPTRDEPLSIALARGDALRRQVADKPEAAMKAAEEWRNVMASYALDHALAALVIAEADPSRAERELRGVRELDLPRDLRREIREKLSTPPPNAPEPPPKAQKKTKAAKKKKAAKPRPKPNPPKKKTRQTSRKK
jgi:hypothetical protein